MFDVQRVIGLEMQLITEVQAHSFLGIVRPKGVVALTEIEDIVGWMLDKQGSRINKFVLSLQQTSLENDIAILLIRMADLALEPQVIVAVCLPDTLDESAIAAAGFSPRVSFFHDEVSAIGNLG